MTDQSQSRRDLNLISLSIFFWGMGESMFLIFQPLYLQRLGASPVKIGTILSINFLAMAISHIPVGLLSDRVGRRPLLWISWFTGTFATLLMALANSLGLFITGLFFYTLTGSVIAPTNGYISNARGDWSVGRALSFFMGMFGAGSTIGPMIGGLLADRFSLREVYFFALGIFVISTLIVLFIRDQAVTPAAREHTPFSVLRNRAFVWTLAGIFLLSFSSYLPFPLSATFLENERGLLLTQIGQLGTLGNASVMLLNLILGRLDPMSAFILAQSGMLLFAGLISRGNQMLWYALAFLFSAGYRVVSAMSPALVRPMVPDARLGFAFGILEAVRASAHALAPIAAGLLYDASPQSMYSVSLGLGGAVLMGLIFLHLRRQKTSQVEL